MTTGASAAARRSAARGTLEPPLIVIERSAGWRTASLRELWEYRELVYFLTWRDVKVRYRQTILGALWAVLQPVATMAAFSLFFGRVAHVPAAGLPYPLFVFAGLLPWIFFANAITWASQSVVANQNLVAKVYFPRLIIPASAVGPGLIDFAIASGVLLLMMAFYGIAPGPDAWMAPVLVGALVVAALGVGILLAAVTVAYRDVRHAVPFLVQFWLFATPGVYMHAGAILDPFWVGLLPLNPAHGLIAGFRNAMMGGDVDLGAVAISSLSSLALLVVGCTYFRRVERRFADVI